MYNLKRLRSIILALFVLLVIMLYFILSSAFPDSPIDTSSITRFNLVSVIPEAWAFFTRSPREENVYVYEKTREGKWKLVNIPGASPSFLFGLDRSGRAFSAELQMILNQLPDSESWTESSISLANFLKVDTLAVQKVKNTSLLQRCKKDLIIQKVRPTPWAWASLNDFVMPYKIIKIHVEESN